MGLFRVSNDAEAVKSPWDGNPAHQGFCRRALRTPADAALRGAPGSPERQGREAAGWLCLRMRHVSMLLSGAIPVLSGLRYPLARTGKRRYNYSVPSQRADSRGKEKLRRSSYAVHERSHVQVPDGLHHQTAAGSSRLPTALPASSASYTATTTSMPKACWVCSPCPSERGRGSRSPQTERMPERRWMRWSSALPGREPLEQT